MIDIKGDTVTAVNPLAKSNIIMSLSPHERKYLSFDSKGILNANILSLCRSNSKSYSALLAEAKSTINYKYMVTDRDHNGKLFTEKQDRIYRGVTEMPKDNMHPSPDKNVWVLTSILSFIGNQVKNTAHEGYGHAYFYELTKSPQLSSHTYDLKSRQTDPSLGLEGYEIYRIPTNVRLEEQIQDVENEATNNFRYSW